MIFDTQQVPALAEPEVEAYGIEAGHGELVNRRGAMGHRDAPAQ